MSKPNQLLERIKTLDDAEMFLRTNLPSTWSLTRGRNTHLTKPHAKDFDVIQCFKPNGELFAELWAGYYPECSPNHVSGHYGPRFDDNEFCFSFASTLVYAIVFIMKEAEANFS